MKKINKLFFLLTLMLVGFIGINGVKANSYPEYVKIKGTKLTAEKPYYLKKNVIQAVENCTLGEDGCMAYYDATRGELVLNNYDAYVIENEIVNTDLTIKLVGANTITAYSDDNFGIVNNSGNLVITSDEAASLRITFETSTRDKSVGITNGYINSSDGSITIAGNASLDIFLRVSNSSLDYSELIGIHNPNGIVNISDNANVRINGSYPSSDSSKDKLYGINANEVNINTTANVDIDTSNGSKPINGDLNLISFDTITLKTQNATGLASYASIKDEYITKYLFNNASSSTLIITKDNKLSGIMIHTYKQYEMYKDSRYSKIVLGDDIEHTYPDNYTSSSCKDAEGDDRTGIYCASLWRIRSDKILDLNGHMLTVYILNLYFNKSATFMITDSAESKNGTLTILDNGNGTINIWDSVASSAGQQYNLIFDGGNYIYDYDSNYSKTMLIINKLEKGSLNIKYKNNPVFSTSTGVGLFKTKDSNVSMAAESLTYRSSRGKNWANLGTSSDTFYSAKTYNDLINKYTTDAFINGKRISLSQRFDTELTDAVDGDNEVIIKPKTIYDLTLSSVSGIVSKTYNAKAQTQNVKLVYDDKTLVKDTDYTVSYKNNKNAGTATVVITGIGDYEGQVTKTFKINKANNPLAVTTKTKSVKYTKVKKKKQVVAPITVTKKQGVVTFVKQKGSSTKLTINKTTGKITVKKGTKKGTYKIKVKINASGNANYKAKYLIKTIKVRVK